MKGRRGKRRREGMKGTRKGDQKVDGRGGGGESE
jgi:hypothetical protein